MSDFRAKMRHFPYIKQNSIAEIVSTIESFLCKDSFVNTRKNALKTAEMSGQRVKNGYFPYIKQNSIAEIVSTMESFLVAEVGFEPHDLRVMSPTSYQAALLRDILGPLVPVTGIEPVRCSRITGF